jgi:hypothetical protein
VSRVSQPSFLTTTYSTDTRLLARAVRLTQASLQRALLLPRLPFMPLNPAAAAFVYETDPARRLISPANIHDQSQSPLFCAIPAELRNEIFRLALQQYVNPKKRYPQETYWTRPEAAGPLRIDTAQLRTCKRVWGETRDMLGKDLTLTFYLGSRARAER